jgi:hypothetical protein
MAAPTQALCNSFKQELAQGLHNFSNPGGNTFNIALFAAAASVTGVFGAATTNYSEMGSNEATGTNYTAGGIALVSVTPVLSGATVILDFSDAVFSNVTLTSSGALIYNVTNGNRAVCVLNFGSDRSASASDFTVQFPTPDVSNAIIRIT